MDKLTKMLREEAEATLWLQDIFNTNVPMYSWLSEEPLNDSIDDEYNALIAEQMVPVKNRAQRRKQTVKKHRRLDTINSWHYDEDEKFHEYSLKPNAKKSASRARSWNDHSKDYKHHNLDFAESLAEYEYQCRVDNFYKLVDQYNSTKYILRWSELEEIEYLEDFGAIYDQVDESLEFDNLEDIHLHIAEAFNEEWEPTCYEIVKVSCGTEELIDAWVPEAVDVPDDEEFFFEPDEYFPFDDSDLPEFDDDDMPEFVDEAPKTEKKYPFDGMSDVAKAIWDFFNEADEDIII